MVDEDKYITIVVEGMRMRILKEVAENCPQVVEGLRRAWRKRIQQGKPTRNDRT